MHFMNLQTVVCIPLMDGVLELGTTERVRPAYIFSTSTGSNFGFLVLEMGHPCMGCFLNETLAHGPMLHRIPEPTILFITHNQV